MRDEEGKTREKGERKMKGAGGRRKVRGKSKWCAALSSVVCLGGPEGQVAGFNANVVFKNIAEPDVYILETYLRNEYLQQNLKNMKLQKKVFKMYFERF